MLITKQLLKQCIQYLIESGFDNTSKAKGVYVFFKYKKLQDNLFTNN